MFSSAAILKWCVLVHIHVCLTSVTFWETVHAENVLDLPRSPFAAANKAASLDHEAAARTKRADNRRAKRRKRQTDCPLVPDPCPDSIYNSKYRTPTGHCNNRANPSWGMAGIPQIRNVPAQYGQGPAGAPRTLGKNGQPLPNPRLVSSTVHAESPGQDDSDRSATVMVMAWGQFIDHDMTKTPMERAADGSALDCCGTDSTSSACNPIQIPEDDPHFSSTGQTCMKFARSVQVCTNCPTSLCSPEQLSAITAFVDGSVVYGSSKDEMDSLREFEGGRLKVKSGLTDTHGYDYLPKDPSENPIDCILNSANEYCMHAGDTRRMEVPHLIVLHTIFMREHNRIAGVLARNNPSLNDETLFQETRRIIGAVLQKITFKDYLPLVIGEELPVDPETSSNSFQSAFSNFANYVASLFSPQQQSFSSGPQTTTYFAGGGPNFYKASTNPSISNAFSTAVFRFGHSQIVPQQKREDTSFRTVQQDDMSSHFFSPTMVMKGGVGDMSRWLADDKMKQTDGQFSPQVRNLLFLGSDGQSLDLVALNIHRGRDHGLAPYNDFRSWCGLSRMVFGSAFADIPGSTIGSLQQLYNDADDIDLFTGGMLETAVPGAMVGPTFKCLLQHQFRRLRDGDRYYYENRPREGQPNVQFTEAQIQEIEKVTLARIICENTSTTSMQPDVFHRKCTGGATSSGFGDYCINIFGSSICFCPVNNRGTCASLGSMDLSHWP